MFLEIIKIYCGAVLAVIPATFVFAYLESRYLKRQENKSAKSSIALPYGLTRYICVDDPLYTGMLYAIFWPFFCYEIGCLAGKTAFKWIGRS